jgi:hypothetical protein
VSLRPIKVYAPLPAVEKKLSVAVIEKDGRLAKWVKARGHNVVLAWGHEKPDVLVVGEGMQNDASLRGYGFAMSKRVDVGGMRLVVLEQPSWTANGMSMQIFQGLSSASLRVPVEWVFPNPELEKQLGGREDFTRLNGCDHVALRVRLELPKAVQAAGPLGGTGQPGEATGIAPQSSTAPATAAATRPAQESPWRPLVKAFCEGPKDPDWAMAHRKFGAGEIIACQVPLMDRCDTARPHDFDPVAERMLAWLIEGQVATSAR